jgi:UDP-4-amino-4,6-dideoxy-N-acetyl-beta-L-altrosamine transaminase
MSRSFLHYGHQVIDEADIAAVVDVLKSDWLTTGPAVAAFEEALVGVTGARHAVVCNSGTAALYLAMRALPHQPGDTVIVPAMTFVATASAAVLAGFDVAFTDVDPDTGLMGARHVEAAIKRSNVGRIAAVCPVHLGGRIGDQSELADLAQRRQLAIVEDACHALGTEYGNGGFRIGGCAHSTAACFSFHPVKTATMGEGGAVTTNSPELAERMRVLRSHGIDRRPNDMHNRDLALGPDGMLNPWYYEVAEISHNFRASDLNCALGQSQLRKLPAFIAARRNLMAWYGQKLAPLAPDVRLIPSRPDSNPGWHLCSILVDFAALGTDRATVMRRLRERGVGSQVHYIPVYLHPYYRRRSASLDLPGANAYYARTLSLPLHPSMTKADVDIVVDALKQSI